MIAEIIKKIWDLYYIRSRENGPEIVRAQYEACSSHLPLIHVILLTSIWGVSLTSKDCAPAWLAFSVPVVFTVFSVMRIVHWTSTRSRFMTIGQARKAMARTRLLGGLLPVVVSCWALALFEVGDHVVRVNIAYFMAISGVCIVVFLMHLRIAAYQIAIIVYVPLIGRLLLTGDTALMTMGINLAVASAMLLTIVYVQSRHFREAVYSKAALQKASEHNQTLANLDSLTGLPNRRLFFSNLDDEIAFAQKNSRRLAVGILDLDGFKAVNDLHGHNIGDQLLMQVAERLNGVLGSHVLVSRLGGDEFALLIKSRNSNSELLLTGEKICSVLRTPFFVEDVRISISGSIGYAVYPDVARTPHELYECADYALYQNKRANRGYPGLFAKEQAHELEARSMIEQAIRAADLEKELTVHFQPIIDIRSHRVAALEALARWESPMVGTVSPAVFIPIAERSGKVGEITLILLKKALAVASEWPRDVNLSFNLSAHDVSSVERVAKLAAVVMQSRVDPRRIDFEITETAAMGNVAQTRAAVAALKTLGCGISLDDFGTGFSSLTQLHAFPLTTIKIDRSFVSELDKKPASYKIVKSLLALSRDMGVECIVEGVETAEELAVVTGLGGRYVQGYYWSPPVPASELGAFLSARKADAPAHDVSKSETIKPRALVS
ncbi:EAL domain-containing protein [uncultured Cohaesibacter sp.]|uniref:putative bifunctional diguanylate cyclase/phosphodiesterase n=1 Tax=uncultured Cohaesibacter sp. TaxID=1002546 RepID=UPI0029C6FE21|nr:EAL domain-containing protein [uncultured Cohaesibacter sp.]